MLPLVSLKEQAFFFEKKVRSMVLNFGPQHPASHGVLRLVLLLDGEFVLGAEPHIGFLHRGSEFLMAGRNYLQNIFFLDRLDYTSVITQAHAYCLCVEQLVLFTHKKLFSLGFRTIFDELGRLLNHLLAVSTHALDIGTMSPLF